MRYYINKSRSGHYTVTVRDERGVLTYREEKLPHLQAARNAVTTRQRVEHVRNQEKNHVCND